MMFFQSAQAADINQMRIILILTIFIIYSPISAKAELLVADLSKHMISITTGFTGTELLLFGSTDSEGTIVITVKGPREKIITRQKSQVGGIWMNKKAVTFEGVPSFYHMAITNNKIFGLPLSARRRHEIGADNVRFNAVEDMPKRHLSPFRQAVIRNKQKAGLYSSTAGVVQRRGGELFRSSVVFPVNVPTGTYIIETLLINNGEVKSATTTPLFINKVGFGAYIYNFAHQYSALYGIVAILIAAMAGFAANWVFRKS